MTVVIAEVFVLLLLLVANGVFAMTGIAIVSARKPRLRRLAEQGDSRARAALELAESPNQTLAGFVVKQLGHVPREGETFQMHGSALLRPGHPGIKIHGPFP